MAAAIFIGIDLGPETKRMNEAFENLVAASMSRIRLPIPGLEFQRGLQARKFMLEFVGDLLDKKRAGDGSDMLSRLCRAETDEGERFTDQAILDHMIFLVALLLPAVLFLIWAIVVSVSDNVLKPMLLGRGVDVPMIVILVGAIGGLLLEGIIGLFVGAVVLALGYKVFLAWLEAWPAAKPSPQIEGVAEESEKS